MKIYDTKTQQKQVFEPQEPNHIRMYVCGPTVYNYIHIGNARTFISFDNIRRYLLWRGFEVTFVQNITDIDDKIIARAFEEGVEAHDIAEAYAQAFIEDMRAVRVLDPTVRPRATQDVDAMIHLVNALIEKGHAYESAGDVYFDVRSFPRYGALSHRNIDELEQGHRDLRNASDQLENRKRDPLDFALWKAAKAGEPAWESPWGSGRPGWHIECSCMSHAYAGLPLDIHGGGSDLAFPHHENEIAQSEAGYGGEFARYWMHSGMLRLNNEKMSKSLGNFVLLRDIIQNVEINTLRMLMAQTHYRSSLDFSDERLHEAESSLERIQNLLDALAFAKDNAQTEGGDDTSFDYVKFDFASAGSAAKEAFVAAMDDDFNTAAALAAIFTLISDVNAAINARTLPVSAVADVEEIITLIQELLGVFAIEISPQDASGSAFSLSPDAEQILFESAARLAQCDTSQVLQALDALLEVRAKARAEKRWDVADAVRDAIQSVGLRIDDTPQGAKVVQA